MGKHNSKILPFYFPIKNREKIIFFFSKPLICKELFPLDIIKCPITVNLEIKINTEGVAIFGRKRATMPNQILSPRR